MTESEYLRIKDLWEPFKFKERFVRERIASGTFVQGIHYFRVPGSNRILFKKSALIAWLEGAQQEQQDNGVIPMARGYSLGGSE